ncbi:DUF4355 domain-containing protein [Clostridium thermosuccinogenes]|uniref:DUF4355 domain-containing protein n=1 Tax=Clostridium thermosuccinogenes TaxID=84032 RepID=UPI000CCBDEAE|nr:DUF4355 domain-containing protein [Pseudoclostridium thermosuccinogenes]PNT94154.1 hypothetical protein CDQ83_11945 [Pseudoclostridium thermosuccinogenes]
MKNWMKIDLQHFAGDDNTDNSLKVSPTYGYLNNSDNTNTENQFNKDNSSKDNKDNKDSNVLTITQEELDKIITKRLERERKKAEEEKAEAERLAKMSAEERAREEFRKEKEKFELERKQYQREKLELQITKELAAKDLPTEFAPYLLADDADTCMSNIKTFESMWQKAIEKAVDAKLKGNTPKAGNSNTQTTYTTADLANMSIEDINKIWDKVK